MAKFTQTYPPIYQYSNRNRLNSTLQPASSADRASGICGSSSTPSSTPIALAVSAHAAQEFSPVADRLRLLLALDTQWQMGRPVNALLVKQARVQASRKAQPSAASSTARASRRPKVARHAAWMSTSKRPAKTAYVVDTLGFLLLVVVTSAGSRTRPCQVDFAGALRPRQAQSLQPLVPTQVDLGRRRVQRHRGLCAPALRLGAGNRQAPRRGEGFKVLPRRWVAERTFGWLGRYRRLARDYEHTVSSSEAIVYLASLRRTLKVVTSPKPTVKKHSLRVRFAISLGSGPAFARAAGHNRKANPRQTCFLEFGAW